MQDNRKTALLVLVLAAMLFSLLTVFAAGSGRAKTSAKAAILYRADTGEVLYESNSEARLPMASTTKIMTALIALERCDLRSEVTIPREAAGIEGSTFLRCATLSILCFYRARTMPRRLLPTRFRAIFGALPTL